MKKIFVIAVLIISLYSCGSVSDHDLAYIGEGFVVAIAGMVFFLLGLSALLGIGCYVGNLIHNKIHTGCFFNTRIAEYSDGTYRPQWHFIWWHTFEYSFKDSPEFSAPAKFKRLEDAQEWMKRCFKKNKIELITKHEGII